MSNAVDLIPIDLSRRVIATLLLPTTSNQQPNSPNFHIMKLPTPDADVDQLRHLVVEYFLQTRAQIRDLAVWWTSYIVLARPGTSTRDSGVYTEWSEFGTVSSQPAAGIIAPRASGILIADISKGT